MFQSKIIKPLLIPRVGYCEYSCTLCGQVCPTGAIKKLEQTEKEKVKIGLAVIDKGRCLPYAHATPCIVCQEVCLIPKKAIWLEKVNVMNREGIEMSLNQPHVDEESHSYENNKLSHKLYFTILVFTPIMLPIAEFFGQ